EVDAYYEDFQFAKLSDALFHFAWDEVFDWYVELSKTTFQAGGEAAEVSKRVLGEVLDVTLRLLHPVVPFVTETLWTTLTGGESVVIADWPTDSGFRDADAEREIATLQSVITEVRRFRADQGLQPGQRLPARLTLDGTTLAGHEAAIRQLIRLQLEGDAVPGTASVPVGGAEVARDVSGTIDVAAERKRLAKDLAAAQKERQQAEAKLGNEAFLAKAPDHVVDKIRTRLAKAEEDIVRVDNQLSKLPETWPPARGAGDVGPPAGRRTGPARTRRARPVPLAGAVAASADRPSVDWLP